MARHPTVDRTTSGVLRTIVHRALRALGAAGAPPRAGDPRQVRLLAHAKRAPTTPEESLILRELQGAGPRAVDDVVAGISRKLYEAEWRRGGWAADIAIVGLNLFARDVARALEEGNGDLWEVTPKPSSE